MQSTFPGEPIWSTCIITTGFPLCCLSILLRYMLFIGSSIWIFHLFNCFVCAFLPANQINAPNRILLLRIASFAGFCREFLGTQFLRWWMFDRHFLGIARHQRRRDRQSGGLEYGLYHCQLCVYPSNWDVKKSLVIRQNLVTTDRPSVPFPLGSSSLVICPSSLSFANHRPHGNS